MNSFSINRTHALIIATAALLLFVIVHHIWADWGLITIHAKQEPLGKVIASMQRQGHAKIQTDMALDTPVTMDLVKVTLTDALETLSANTDSRWRLLYFVAGNKAALKSGELSWFSGQRPDGWKMVSFPMGNMIQTDDDPDPTPLDPRYDSWTPKTSGPAPVQTFFAEAAQLTNAGFAFPADWNPTVNSAPKPGVVQRVVPKLVGAAHGKQDELFFLSKNSRRFQRERGDGQTADFHFDPNLFAEKMQSEINRLPLDQRSEAQTMFNTERAFRASLQGLTDEQRRAAWLAHMQDPQVQQQMANRLDGRDGRLSHTQRMQRFSNYVQRKLSITGKL